MNQIRHIEDIARGLLVGRTHPPLGGLREPPAPRPQGTVSRLAMAIAGTRHPAHGAPRSTPTPPHGMACAADRDCGRAATCRDGACRCAPGWDRCDPDRCHFLPMSHAHCGRCGAACGPDQLCSNGRCV